MLAQCWVDVGPASQTLGQHQPSIGPTSRVMWRWDMGLCHYVFLYTSHEGPLCWRGNVFVLRFASCFVGIIQSSKLLREAPLDIWGGGLEFFLVANFFFHLRKKTTFFWGGRWTSDNYFSYLSLKNWNMFFLVCLGYDLVVFLVNIFFFNFDNKLFFCLHFQQYFFSDFCGDKLF